MPMTNNSEYVLKHFMATETQNTILKLIHTATPDTTKLSCLCLVRLGAVNWIADNSRLSPTENLMSEHVNSNNV